MPLRSISGRVPGGVFAWLLLVCVVAVPILASRHFPTPDGAGHLYSSWVMLRIWSNDPLFTQFFSLNATPVPNLTGHLLLGVLQAVVSAALSQKLILIMVFAAFTGAVAWFQHLCDAKAPVYVTALYSAAVGLNGFWLVGAYNFLIGMSLGLVTVGLFCRWRDDMRPARAGIIVILVLATYFSHLMTLGILLASICVMAASARNKRRAFAVLAVAVLVCIPLFWSYYSLVTSEGAAMAPGWSVDTAGGVRQWLPPNVFGIMSGRYVPFVEDPSAWFILLSPVLYIGLALLFSFRPTWTTPTRRLLLAMVFVTAILGVVAPDNFGARNGTLIRERMVLYACAMAPSFFSSGVTRLRQGMATVALCLAIVYQVGVLFEYGHDTSVSAAEFVSAVDIAPTGAGMAAVVVLGPERRFNVQPEPQLLSYAAAGREIVVWDDYEWGYYMFATGTAARSDREFAADLTRSNLLYPWAAPGVLDEKRSGLKRVLKDPRIDLLCVYGSDDAVDRMVIENFDPVPVYRGPQLRAFRRRSGN